MRTSAIIGTIAFLLLLYIVLVRTRRDHLARTTSKSFDKPFDYYKWKKHYHKDLVHQKAKQEKKITKMDV